MFNFFKKKKYKAPEIDKLTNLTDYHEVILSYEISELAKKKGYDNPSKYYYDCNTHLHVSNNSVYSNDEITVAPTSSDLHWWYVKLTNNIYLFDFDDHYKDYFNHILKTLPNK